MTDSRYEQFYQLFVQEFEDTFAEVRENIPGDDQKFAIIRSLLVAAARLSFADGDTAHRVFDLAQSFGAHFLPVHFYSPVPQTDKLPAAVWRRRYDNIPGLEIEEQKTRAILDQLSEFGPELSRFSRKKVAERFYFENPAFGPGDATVYYCMVRHFKPRTIIEIGAGYSTLLALEAIKENGRGEMICIEPYPNDDIAGLARNNKIRLIDTPVQEVDLQLFSGLGPNDILFIDSSHVCKTGSDVVFEFLNIIPSLQPGVHVHIHDIFFPLEYSEDWIINKKIFWNEMYVLLAFMAFNGQFKMLLPNYVFAVDEAFAQLFRSAFPGCDVIGGGSYWFQRLVQSTLPSKPVFHPVEDE